MTSFKISHINRIIPLLTAFLLLLTVTVNKEHKLFGTDLQNIQNEAPADLTEANGTRVLSTRKLCKDIFGYGGPVPLEIRIRNGRIQRITALPNSETPRFFRRIERSGLLEHWNGLTPDEALGTEVDALTGATLSSSAVIASVRRTMTYVQSRPAVSSQRLFGLKFWCVLVVVLCGLILPLVYSSPRIRIIQQSLNVVVLGLWGGMFLSLSRLTNYLANGMNPALSVIPLLLLIAAFVFPLFRRKGFYCAHLCPLGSLQELAGHCSRRKLRMGPHTIQWLNRIRQGLWFALLFIMWCGIGFGIMDYELFTAFLFRQATWPVLAAAGAFLVLSCFVPRPYCRFVCPTGTLFRFTEKSN